MKIMELTRHGFPSSLVEAWRMREGDELLPLQAEAVRCGVGRVRRGAGSEQMARSSFVISAPTSAGKSFCGELALAAAVMERRKGVFVTPLKSVAMEQYESFAPVYSALGLRVIIATSDHPASDRALEQDFDNTRGGPFADLLFSLRHGHDPALAALSRELDSRASVERQPRYFKRAEIAILGRLGLYSVAQIVATCRADQRTFALVLERASFSSLASITDKLARLCQADATTHHSNATSGTGEIAVFGRVEDSPMPSVSRATSGANPAVALSAPYSRNGSGALTLGACDIVSIPSHARGLGAPANGAPCRLEIDGLCNGERYLIKIDGVSVWLTGKSFKYLTRLAAARLARPDGWLYKDDLENGFNQARYLYRMRHEIIDALPGSVWMAYENNRLGYYRLGVDPAGVEMNVEALSANPDFEVRQVVGWLAVWRESRQAV